jgi:hypothetical protein
MGWRLWYVNSPLFIPEDNYTLVFTMDYIVYKWGREGGGERGFNQNYSEIEMKNKIWI